ncbi:hypothetical protein Nepgr_010380 [Nepenthes gracilis]|uniref:RING-type domain-containing protein n=1 Tax=Nepenthes gracilis TaxID=150966 RepID=A0AAD3SCC5_NEPGR|nr:hypothetical protein Nepgr_010380 [Nepenthes gracilis]
MGQQQSKDELLYHQVYYGNAGGIKALRSQGAGVEYIDREGKTPLIVACLRPELYNVAKTLIELGANVNAYRPGHYGGTPLHHAAKHGLEQTAELLLSHGANALLINDDCQTPVEIARVKGYGNVVRKIESHICLFAGWLRELYAPGFLEVLAPQLLSRKVWVVVLPCGSHSLKKPFKLELAIYARSQDAQPRTTVALWKANMEEPAVDQSDPAVIISEASTKARIRLAPVNESDKQQLLQFCKACKGIPQVMHPTFPFNTSTASIPATAPPAAEDMELTMAINASIQSAMEAGIPLDQAEPISRPSASSINMDKSSDIIDYPTFIPPDAPPLEEWRSQRSTQAAGPSNSAPITSEGIHEPTSAPSVPLIVNSVMDSGPICYPSIDSSPINMSALAAEDFHATGGGTKEEGSSSSCVICLDAPAEGACVPCGHLAGCMSCLSEVKAKKLGCPICRAEINQVIRVYAV